MFENKVVSAVICPHCYKEHAAVNPRDRIACGLCGRLHDDIIRALDCCSSIKVAVELLCETVKRNCHAASKESNTPETCSILPDSRCTLDCCTVTVEDIWKTVQRSFDD